MNEERNELNDSSGSTPCGVWQLQHGDVECYNMALEQLSFKAWLDGNRDGWERSEKLSRILDELATEIYAQTGERAKIHLK